MQILTNMLSIELTQKCNLDCKHCLMGESKDVFITRDIVEKLFDELKYISRIFFTGGEVMLAYNEMKMVLDVAKEKGVTINSAGLYTNGTIYDQKIYDLLNKEFGNNFYVGISDDDYHLKSINRIYKNKDEVINTMRKHLKDYHSIGFKDAESILFNTGRAKNLDVPKVECSPIGYYYDFYRNGLLVGPIIYVSADGYISDGNYEISSYEEASLGNLKTNSLSEMIINGGIKINLKSINEFFAFCKKRQNDYQKFKGDYLQFENHKLVYKEAPSMDDLHDAYREADELLNRIIAAEKELPGSGLKIIEEYDFSKYPHDLSQIDHSDSIRLL